jgi:hypothetical protein
MQRFVELYVFLGFLVVGISHITMAAAWNDFFALLRSKGRAGVIVNGMLALTVGSIVVAGHNVWSGLPIIVTLVGWAQLLKGFLHLAIPSIGERSLQMAKTNPVTKFRIGGAIMLILDIPVAYLVFTPT